MTSVLGYLCSSTSWGGLELNHLRNAAWMKARGHQVIVFGIENSPFQERAQSLGLHFQPILPHKKYYDFKAARKLKAIVREHGVTHLVIRDTKDVSIAARLKYKLKKDIHVSYFMEMQLGVPKTNPLHTLRYKYIDVWSCPLPWLADQVRTMTKFNNKLVEIPSGIELEPFEKVTPSSQSRQQFNLPQERVILGLIGRFDPQKGQLDLLEAVNQSERSDYDILLVGEPTRNEGSDYNDRLMAEVEKHKQRVHVLPYQKDLVDVYSSIDALVMATNKESIGMVTIEALASGTPVVGSNSGGTPELVQAPVGGVLFEPENSESLAGAIDQFLNTRDTFNPSHVRSLIQPFAHHRVCEMVEDALAL